MKKICSKHDYYYTDEYIGIPIQKKLKGMKLFVLVKNVENEKVLDLRKKHLTNEPKGSIISM